MNIQGLQKLTLLDYPEHVAATLFTGGCQLNCPYCHNSELISGPFGPGEDTDAVLAGVADGDEVSGYARDAVAWAVENGYVASNGNLIDPQGTVYRGRVVTIAVRYQPEQANLITRS